VLNAFCPFKYLDFFLDFYQTPRIFDLGTDAKHAA